MPFEQQNQVEKPATSNPTQGTAALAQQAWAPRSGQENTAPAQKPADMQQVLDQGLAAVGDLFGGIVRGVENGAKAVANEVQHVVAPQAAQPAEQQSQQAAQQSTPSESGAPSTMDRLGHLAQSIGNNIGQGIHDTLNPLDGITHGLQAAAGVVEGVGDMLHETGAAIGYAATHPGETIAKVEQIGAKIGTNVICALQTTEHVMEQVAAGDVKGLGEDLQQAGKAIGNGFDEAVKGADYLMSATPEEQGKFIGHYVLPGIVIGIATEGIGTAAMGAAMGAMGISEAALGAGIAVTGATEAGIAMTGATEIGIGLTGATEAGIALTGATEVATNLVGGAAESVLMQAGKTVLRTVAQGIKEGEEGLQGAVNKAHEAFEHAHETLKKGAEVAEQAHKGESAGRVGESARTIAQATPIDATLPNLEIMEHAHHDTPNFPEIDRIFGKDAEPITDPKEFERQIEEMVRSIERSAKQPKNITNELPSIPSIDEPTRMIYL